MGGDKIIVIGGRGSAKTTGEIVKGKFKEIGKKTFHFFMVRLQVRRSFPFKMVDMERVQSPTRLDS